MIGLVPVGRVESPLKARADAPKQGDEGAPEAWLVFEPAVADALDGIDAGADVILLTWLDRARATCCACVRAATRHGPYRACSTPGPRTARTRSACTA